MHLAGRRYSVPITQNHSIRLIQVKNRKADEFLAGFSIFDNSIRKQPIRRRKYGQAGRPISTGQLNTLLCVHLPPINLVVYEGPSGRPHLGGGFPLRCFQRLSLPHMATERCRWRDNSYTRGASIPVLSYWGQLPSSLLRPRQIGTELSHDVLNPARGPL
jgi:hypothetical protein